MLHRSAHRRFFACSALAFLTSIAVNSVCHSQEPPASTDETIVIGSDIDVITASFDELVIDGVPLPTICNAPKSGQPPTPSVSTVNPANGQPTTSKSLNPLRKGIDLKTDSRTPPTSANSAEKISSQSTVIGKTAPINNAVQTKLPLEKSSTKDGKDKLSEKVARKAQEDQQEAPDLPTDSTLSFIEDKVTLTDEPKKPIVSTSKKVDSPDTEKVKNIVLTPEQTDRQKRIRSCLAYYMFRPESTSKRSPWGAMHSMLPFGVDAELIAGNKRVNAIGWLCYNGRCRTQQLFRPTPKGFTANIGPGFQGHEGQFLAMLAQSHVSADYPIRVGSNQFTISNLVRYEMAGCIEQSELTFKLIGLSHYLNTDQQWKSSNGHRWSIHKLIDEELSQPIVGSACGGTHRLMGLTYSVRKRQREEKPIDGSFLRAAIFIDEFIDYAWTLQNSDGSFSTNWFESRGNENDVDRKVQTTGHILEWLVFALNPKELESERVQKSIDFLVANLLDNRNHDWSIGPRSHALRALSLYDQKMFDGQPGQRREVLAEINQKLFLR